MKKLLLFIYWNIVFEMLKLLPLQNKVFFESFLGESYSDSPKAMFEYMYEHNDFKYVWSFRNPDNYEDDRYIKTKRLGLKYLYHIATSKYIVNNSRMPIGFKKRKNQVYVQTWHGTPLKRLVFDVNMDNNEKYLQDFAKEVSNWDILLSPNSYSTKIFKSAFKYNGNIMEKGYPRNQELVDLNDEEVKELKKKFAIPASNRVILYAPTFRDNKVNSKNQYIQEINLNFENIDTKNTTFILRNHYLVKEISYKYEKPLNVLDLSAYNNINDLYKITDVLITDYSSVFFDFMLLNKPIIFYQYDQNEYSEDIRGFYIPVSELPGVVVHNEDELYDVLNHDITVNYSDFNQKYNCESNEVEITKKIVEEIFN